MGKGGGLKIYDTLRKEQKGNDGVRVKVWKETK